MTVALVLKHVGPGGGLLLAGRALRRGMGA